jgi:rod shape-determining protein MreC
VAPARSGCVLGPGESRRRRLAYTEVLVPRNRSVRIATLGASRGRPLASSQASSRAASVLRRRVVVVVLVAVSLALLTVYFRESSSGGLHSVQSAGSTVLRPFEVAANRIAQPFRDAVNWVEGLNDAESENTKLRRENDALRKQVIQSQAAERENIQLRKLLRYEVGPTFPSGYEAHNTRVLGRPSGQFDQQVIVAVGRGDGVRLHDPVVTAEGLVGQVTKLTSREAQVTLLTDPSSAVSTLDPRTGASGIVLLNDTGSGLILDQVPKAWNVFPGDSLVTAGWRTKDLSSIYPRGIPIATVTSVNQTDIDPYKEIVVKPLVDFSSLEAMAVLVPKAKQNQAGQR